MDYPSELKSNLKGTDSMEAETPASKSAKKSDTLDQETKSSDHRHSLKADIEINEAYFENLRRCYDLSDHLVKYSSLLVHRARSEAALKDVPRENAMDWPSSQKLTSQQKDQILMSKRSFNRSISADELHKKVRTILVDEELFEAISEAAPIPNLHKLRGILRKSFVLERFIKDIKFNVSITQSESSSKRLSSPEPEDRVSDEIVDVRKLNRLSLESTSEQEDDEVFSSGEDEGKYDCSKKESSLGVNQGNPVENEAIKKIFEISGRKALRGFQFCNKIDVDQLVLLYPHVAPVKSAVSQVLQNFQDDKDAVKTKDCKR